MQLELQNIAKMKEAKIKFDGITVIAGENNTGKSTIGKVVYSIFNSMYNMEKKNIREKHNKIEEIVWRVLQGRKLPDRMGPEQYRRINRTRARKLANIIMNIDATDDVKNIQSIVEGFFEDLGIQEDTKEFVEECVFKVKNIIEVSDEKLMMEVVTRWFN